MIQEPSERVKVVKNLFVRMRDGVHIAVDLIQPNDLSQRVPAIIETNPYRKDDFAGMANEPKRRSLMYFAERGYVVVRADARGTGGSEGASVDMYEPEVLADGYELVEWAARQPWCNGAVGMFGTSWGAVHSYQIAMQQPPSLKAIVPMLGTDEVYADTFYPGGTLRGLFELGDYASNMIATSCSPPDPDYSGDKWAEIWNHRLRNNSPWVLNWLEHQRDGEYWRSKSLNPGIDRIKCATFVIMGWNDRYTTSACRVFTQLRAPKRLIIGPWQHDYMDSGLPGPRIDHLHEIARWFDQYLKGRDTGVSREPPITIFVRRYDPPASRRDTLSGFWRSEEEWVPRRVKTTTMFMSGDCRLADSVPSEEGSDVYEYNPTVGITGGFMGGLIGQGYGLPLDQRLDEAYSLTYTSNPLLGNLEMLGPAETFLHFSSSAGVINLIVKVCDVAPDGTSFLVTRGILNTSHRESHTNPSKLEAGSDYTIKVTTDPAAYIFSAGHRIRVDISSSDFPNVWPTPETCVNTVRYGPNHQSRILIPVAPPQEPALPPPTLIPSQIRPPEPRASEKPTYLVTFDIPNESASVKMGKDVVMPIDARTVYESRRAFEMTVCTSNPALTVVKGNAVVRVTKPQSVFETTGTCITRSTGQTFDVTAILNVAIDGKQYFSNTWNRSFPRDHV